MTGENVEMTFNHYTVDTAIRANKGSAGLIGSQATDVSCNSAIRLLFELTSVLKETMKSFKGYQVILNIFIDPGLPNVNYAWV